MRMLKVGFPLAPEKSDPSAKLGMTIQPNGKGRIEGAKEFALFPRSCGSVRVNLCTHVNGLLSYDLARQCALGLCGFRP